MSAQPRALLSLNGHSNGNENGLDSSSQSRASSATSGWASEEDATQYTMAELGLSSRSRNCGECPLCFLLVEPDVLSTLLAGEFIYISSIEGMEQNMISKKKKLCELYKFILEKLRTIPVRTEHEWAGGMKNKLLTPIVNSKTGAEDSPFTVENKKTYYGPICACMIVHRGDDMEPHTPLRSLKFTIRHPQTTMIPTYPKKSSQYEVKFSDLVIAVFALQDDPAAEYVSMRPPNPMLNSDVTFKLARSWLEECELLHSGCKDASNSRGPLGPGRLLELGKSKNHVELVELNVNVHVRYATLTYCGGLKKENLTTPKTLKSNLQDIKVSKLPKAIKEAISVVRRLDIPYLWVDGLCMIHGSRKDKDLETSKIAQIFTNAVLNIVAANNDDPYKGFLRPCTVTEELLQKAVRMPVYCPNNRSGSIYLSMQSQVSFDEEPINKHAWTLQKMWLSPRMLIFSSNQLQWQCLNTSLADGGNETCSEFHRRRYEILHAAKMMRPGLESRDYYLRIWEDIVNDYTKRIEGEAEDKLANLAGVAADFHNVFITFDKNEQYAAGLWTSCFPTLLMWYQPAHKSNSIYSRPTDYRAPSWSWASVTGLIEPGSSVCQAKGRVPSLEVLKVTIERPKGHQYGNVTHAELQVQGNMCSMTKVEVNHRFNICSPQYFPAAGWTVDMIIPDAGDANKDFAHGGTNVAKQSKGLWDYVRSSSPAQDFVERGATCPQYWFLEVWSATISTGPCGLVLQKVETGVFRRTGIFMLPLTTRRVEYSTGMFEKHWDIKWSSEVITII